jgi:hypothetical protein
VESRLEAIRSLAGRWPKAFSGGLKRLSENASLGGEGGNRWSGGFGRQILRAPLLSLFVSQSLQSLNARVRTEDLDVLRGLIESGKVTPVIDRTYPLAQASEAIRYMHERHARGKVVVTVEGGVALLRRGLHWPTERISVAL